VRSLKATITFGLAENLRLSIRRILPVGGLKESGAGEAVIVCGTLRAYVVI
jgi:hypothetical protein